jgi:RNA polymerase sigma-70 factor (ECF subfamily)
MEAAKQIAFQEPGLAAKEETIACDDRFADLVRRQSRFVFRVAYSILRNAHDSEDVVQETFLKVYQRRRWDAIENERAFLARIAWRSALDRRPRAVELADCGIPSSGESPEQAAIAADWQAVVHRLIATLPEELRLPLALSTVEDLNSREIALAMGIPEGTVRTRLMRSRQLLKQKLSVLMGGAHGA